MKFAYVDRHSQKHEGKIIVKKTCKTLCRGIEPRFRAARNE